MFGRYIEPLKTQNYESKCWIGIRKLLWTFKYYKQQSPVPCYHAEKS